MMAEDNSTTRIQALALGAKLTWDVSPQEKAEQLPAPDLLLINALSASRETQN